MQMERAPESMYLFGYQMSLRYGTSKASTGTACLAEHTGRAHQGPVVIFTRVPGLEILVGHRVAVGGEEFRDKFTVTCKRAEDAPPVINAEVESVLLEHAAGLGEASDGSIVLGRRL